MRISDLFPETLFETFTFKGNKVCLVCGKHKAVSMLRSTEREVVPLCQICASKWNFYGYDILKKIKPKQLIWNMFKFHCFNFFRIQNPFKTIQDMKVFIAWATKMKKFMKR